MFTRKQLELIRAIVDVVQVPASDSEDTIDQILENFDNIDPDGSRVEELKFLLDGVLKEN